VNFTLPGGITEGTSEETLLELFGDSLEKRNYSNTEDSWYYKYVAGDQYRQYIEIVITKEEGTGNGLVSGIEMSNRE
jgi:hypothetical protein